LSAKKEETISFAKKVYLLIFTQKNMEILKKIGILAFQGDFLEHQKAIESLGQKAILVRTLEDLAKIDYLIIPGGESTVIGKFLLETRLDKQIQKRVLQKELFVYGTCAGAILLCSEVISQRPINNLGLIHAKISRNSYGSQIDSFSQKIKFEANNQNFEAIFIRAPRILEFNEQKVKVLARFKNEILMLEEENVLISTFHPELVRPALIHQYFLGKAWN